MFKLENTTKNKRIVKYPQTFTIYFVFILFLLESDTGLYGKNMEIFFYVNNPNIIFNC